MSGVFTKGRIALLVIFSGLIIDQIIKIWVKTHMFWHESIRVTDWFYIYFTENRGMAFGMEVIGKLFLTSFRIVAVTFIAWYLYRIVKMGLKTGYIVCISPFLPAEGGYAPLLYGKVVDMFYFPIIDTHWPLWMPFVGGEHFVFFSPIFNFADAAISCGIIALLLFYGKYLNETYHELKKS